MAKKTNEYDYLHISARIHAMEGKMLTRERMERMLDARSAEEAAKVLSECGYEEFTALTPSAIDRTLDKARLALFGELRKAAPDPGIVDVFCIKYDYHNAKVLLKAEAMGIKAENLMIDAGRYPAPLLRDDFAKGDLRHGTDSFRRAVIEAKEILVTSGDPQAADFVLDRAYYSEMLEAATGAGSAFLTGYVKLSIDSANLRSVVRSARMGKGAEFLRRVLLPGGDVKLPALESVVTGSGSLEKLFTRTPLEGAAAEGSRCMESGSLTAFERLCDNSLTSYLAQGKRVAFGEHPLIGYLYAREAELTAVRILLTGKLAGLERDILEERLRDCYA